MTNNRRSEGKIRYGEDLIWGVHPVLEALANDRQRLREVFIQKGKHGRKWDELVSQVKVSGVKYYFVERVRVTGAPEGQLIHQGVVARMNSIGLKQFSDLVEAFGKEVASGKIPRVLACDSIQDPHNLGAIIRSAHAAGVNRIIVTKERSAPLAGVAFKASAGALSKVDICQVANLSNALKEIKKGGGWIFGAVKENDARSIYETDFQVPACVVIGNEGEGIRPLVRKHCDVLISIPMAGALDSLNSSAAGAVIMFEMHRQLLVAKKAEQKMSDTIQNE